MIGFFICCGLYIIFDSPIIVEWVRKEPRVATVLALPTNPAPADACRQGPGRAERGHEPAPDKQDSMASKSSSSGVPTPPTALDVHASLRGHPPASGSPHGPSAVSLPPQAPPHQPPIAYWALPRPFLWSPGFSPEWRVLLPAPTRGRQPPFNRYAGALWTTTTCSSAD
ncbi:hypothetical protein CNMCM5623_001859 [Aspergillus felis]|uniref:Uncharacterized protein n=1 Tax=Aspergillus felis TaxID=1287682 RepID=A0A8H6R2B4_9EURO|nr:hypothetical protein CNMCM5623_001859 [Aspergillus felis]KAF7182377.1 hypothetical protein CNMCM7691_001857 [Aspergillus felis]